MTTPKERSEIQGEGDKRSAREFNEQERAFVRSHDTEKLAEDAQPDDATEAAELERAERAGKARARPDPESEAPGDERDKNGGTTDITPPRA